MEDYKKRYEEAIFRMKKWVEGSEIVDPKEVSEFVFPELKESEDESVRKHLLKHFMAKTKEEWNGMPIKNIISWLEKQGEHANFRNKIQIGDEVTRNEDGALVNLSQFKRMVKQGEQKPKKVSLWKHWKDGIAGNEEGKLTYLIKIGNTYNLTSCLGFECDYIELSELDSLTLEKQAERKPTDKVEQEEDVELTDFESALFSAFSDAWQEYLSGKEVNVAKWTKEHSAELLEVAREQKPAWSEEDKVILGEIIDFFENGTVKLQHDLSLYASWLKSLKERIKGE